MRNVIVVAVLAVVSTSVSTFAADAVNAEFFGTWKMNTAKSKADPGPLVKSQTVTIEPHGDGFTLTTDAEDARGAKSHTARTASLDGKEVNVDTNNPSVKETYTRINDRSFPACHEGGRSCEEHAEGHAVARRSELHHRRDRHERGGEAGSQHHSV
jgi:hypothetical protein